MAESPFSKRLAELGLGRFPVSDHAALERLAQPVEAVAARIRLPYGTEEEPSNVVRLFPAVGKRL